MATKTTYYFQANGKEIIGWHTDDISPTLLPAGQKTIKLETDKDPSKFLGMSTDYIKDENPPFPDPNAEKETLPYKRQELKRLYYELKFTEQLEEDITDLQAAYDAKLAEYNAIKTP